MAKGNSIEGLWFLRRGGGCASQRWKPLQINISKIRFLSELQAALESPEVLSKCQEKRHRFTGSSTLTCVSIRRGSRQPPVLSSVPSQAPFAEAHFRRMVLSSLSRWQVTLWMDLRGDPRMEGIYFTHPGNWNSLSLSEISLSFDG